MRELQPSTTQTEQENQREPFHLIEILNETEQQFSVIDA